jgi:hypothetical protein
MIEREAEGLKANEPFANSEPVSAPDEESIDSAGPPTLAASL